MSELHTDDTFMYENCLVGDASMAEDPLVNRITHQRGPKAPSTESQSRALDELVRDAEEIGLYDNELSHPSELVDWSKAPDWANYWAMDSNGKAYWFESKPTIATAEGVFYQRAFTRVTRAPSFMFPVSHWKKSLTVRNEGSKPDQEIYWEDTDLTSLVNRLKPQSDTENEKDPMHRQVSGNHYNKYPIQPAEYCYKNGLNNLQSEAISYITRYGDKGGKTDLEKAIHTLEMLIHMEYGE